MAPRILDGGQLIATGKQICAEYKNLPTMGYYNSMTLSTIQRKAPQANYFLSKMLY